MTWSDLITASLKRINVVQAGGTPSADDLADGLIILNLWIDSLAIEGLTIPFLLRSTWTIVSTKGTLTNPYTVGAGGDIVVVRPPLPTAIVIKYQDTTVTPTQEYKLDRYDDQAWQSIPQKTLTAALPSGAYYNPTYASGLGSLHLWPVPTQASLQGVLYAPSPIAEAAALTDAIVLPAGYKFFIEENLAVKLAATFRENLPLDPELKENARTSKASIKRANIRTPVMAGDPMYCGGGGGLYDIYSDTVSG